MRALSVICLIAAMTALSGHAASAQSSAPDSQRSLDAMSRDPNQWVMPARDYASTRFSALDQINAGNVGQLRPAWTFSVGPDRGQEAAPIVVNDTMYVVAPYAGPYPNRVFALNATTGELKWWYAPKPNPAAAGVACCDVVNRGVAYDNGKIFFNTLDNHAVALDAETGKELWVTKLGDINRGETMTMAPLVVKGKVLVGNSGGEMGVRGWLTALDENNGKIVWRAYSTGPDSDVLIGADFKPHYDWMKGKDLGVSSWPADHWKIGIAANVVGYMIYGDYREAAPPARLIEAVERGDIDVAAAWGPLAGYAALSSRVPLRVIPISDTARFAPLRFQFEIAMGVRKSDHALKTRLDEAIVRRSADIRDVLRDYGVPIASAEDR